MNLAELIHNFERFFIVYFLLLQASYLSLNLLSIHFVSGYLKRHSNALDIDIHTGLEPPISILVAVKNEQELIAGSIKALLQLEYREFEIVVINDGSTDDTLKILKEEFKLVEFPDTSRKRLKTKTVEAVYHSTTQQNLKVLDKHNGGKADALNAGINYANYPLYCSIDADSILQTDSLRKIVTPFMERSDTVAAGGTVRVANGCHVEDGFLVKTGLSSNFLVTLQVVEYLRAFLFGRLGWGPLNALLIISGTFGVFHRETVVEAGGYRTDTVGEDMELVTRLHRYLKKIGKPYHISFVPDPICWTEVPSTLGVLRKQRIRWQHGLIESLLMNYQLPFSLKGGAAGWLAFPFMFLFECLGPIIEISGYLFFIAGLYLGLISIETGILFFFLALGIGVLLSMLALLLEEMSFHIYTQPRQFFRLLLAAVIENFGYRQLCALWRYWGVCTWLISGKSHWHDVQRSRDWAEHRKNMI
ncbi:MAG: glycosyltransferase family 2 protein [Gammaproteobacteria bacterium]|nr:glycosyltransferase family 2 protein [Gammaproteobacteria bacterium]